jgi:hypothetical protein
MDLCPVKIQSEFVLADSPCRKESEHGRPVGSCFAWQQSRTVDGVEIAIRREFDGA